MLSSLFGASLRCAVCRDAIKGMDSLLASGTVEKEAPAIAAFLREHHELLDSMQIGEYFGHHEDQAVSTDSRGSPSFPQPASVCAPLWCRQHLIKLDRPEDLKVCSSLVCCKRSFLAPGGSDACLYRPGNLRQSHHRCCSEGATEGIQASR